METNMDMLEAGFSGVAAPGNRPLLSGGTAASGFGAFVRSGAAVETKAMSGVSDAAGGYAVPREIDAMIDATLKGSSPIRSIANVVTVGSACCCTMRANGRCGCATLRRGRRWRCWTRRAR